MVRPTRLERAVWFLSHGSLGGCCLIRLGYGRIKKEYNIEKREIGLSSYLGFLCIMGLIVCALLFVPVGPRCYLFRLFTPTAFTNAAPQPRIHPKPILYVVFFCKEHRRDNQVAAVCFIRLLTPLRNLFSIYRLYDARQAPTCILLSPSLGNVLVSTQTSTVQSGLFISSIFFCKNISLSPPTSDLSSHDSQEVECAARKIQLVFFLLS